MTWGAVAGAAIGVVGGYMASKSSSDAAQGAADTSSQASKYSANLQKQEFDQQRQDQQPWLQTGSTALNRLSYLMGIGPGGVKTKSQLAAELAPQFTINGRTSAIPATASNSSAFAGGNAPQGYYGSPVGTVDQSGLSSAVDRAFASQKADPEYGSLSRSYPNFHNFTTADFKTDPGYKFRLQQGQDALNNSLLAKGMGLSGAALKEGMRYNQGFASNEYSNAYNRFNTDQTNQYNRFNTDQNNQYNRLASLANVGQTAAGTLGQAGQNYANNVGNLAMTSAANQGNAGLAAASLRGSAYQGTANALGKVDWSKLFSSNGSNDYATQTQNQGIF